MSKPESNVAYDTRYCPWCEYELEGLGQDPQCPECGEPTGPAARAKAAIRRAIGDTRGRLILLISPGLGIFIGLALFVRAGLIGLGLGMVLALIAGGSVSIWHASRGPWRLQPLQVVLLGSLLGIGYFLSLLLAAMVVILPLVLLLKLTEGRAAPLFLIGAIPVVILSGVGVLLMVQWAMGRIAERKKK